MRPVLYTYFTFTFCCLWTASVREQSAVRGRELLSGREGKEK